MTDLTISEKNAQADIMKIVFRMRPGSAIRVLCHIVKTLRKRCEVQPSSAKG